MMLSTEYGFAFIAAPKCASSSIEKTLSKYCNVSIGGPPFLKHMSVSAADRTILSYYREKLPNANVEVFGVVRQPVDWLHSWYRFRARDDLRDPKSPNHLNYTGGISFDNFVRAYLLGEQSPEYANVRNQSHYFRHKDGSLGLDRLFPFENLTLLEQYISSVVGEHVKFPETNVSPDLVFELDEQLNRELYRFLAPDFEMYKEAVNQS